MANPNDHLRRQMDPPLKPLPPSSESKSKAAVWDCGSALYDSAELTSFQRRLDSAISSRTLSMPHLSDRRLPADSINNAEIKPAAGSKLSRSFRKLLRSVFSHGKRKAANDVKEYAGGEGFKRAVGDQKKPAEKETRWFVLHEENDVAVPAPVTTRDSGKVSPGIRPPVGKTVSERFTAVSLTNSKMISPFA